MVRGLLRETRMEAWRAGSQPRWMVLAPVALGAIAACTQQVVGHGFDDARASDTPAGNDGEDGEDGARADDAGAGDATGTADDQTLALLADAGYASSPLFTHVSSGPYPSSAAPGSFVDVWVSSDAYAQYAAITPDGGAADASLPLGTVIVRVVTGEDGGVTKLTLMRRGPAGVDPSLDDWWFAEATPLGVPLEDDAGAVLAGALGGCTPCHLARADSDFLFGVPLSAR